mgnify:CR=1 FL=1
MGWLRVVRVIPLPFTCLHSPYVPGGEDAHGNTIPEWLDPVEVACIWWPVNSSEPPGPPTGSERVVAELSLVVDVSVGVDHRDRFTVEGQLFEATRQPKEYDHGPWGFTPNRQIVELRMVR